MPLVSIIVPCYNEQATIRLLLDAIYQQGFPSEEMEVIIADGLSTDCTRQEIAAFQDQHPQLHVKLVDNPKRAIPAALNSALDAAEGEYIIRLDAHCTPRSDYVARCVADLQAGYGDNVGGVWEIRPGGAGWMARAIAVAAAHPLGVGDARYRYTDQAGEVDTVPFGAFCRQVFERVGRFDESLLTNEDYEFNARLRQQGGKIWIDPTIRSIYFARANLAALARQYRRYGFWKWQMLRRYPQTLRWRQALPPLFVLSLMGLLVLSPWWRLAGVLLGIEVLLYGIALLLGALPFALREKDAALVVGVPLAIATMHLSWGMGFLWSVIQSVWERATK